jgi:hypothetical protein
MIGTKTRLTGKLTVNPMMKEKSQILRNGEARPTFTRVMAKDMKNDITKDTKTEKTIK